MPGFDSLRRGEPGLKQVPYFGSFALAAYCIKHRDAGCGASSAKYYPVGHAQLSGEGLGFNPQITHAEKASLKEHAPNLLNQDLARTLGIEERLRRIPRVKRDQLGGIRNVWKVIQVERTGY